MFARTAIRVAVAAVVAPTLARNTTSVITGLINGADGKAVANAAVTVFHVESGSVSLALRNSKGRYGVPGVRVGGPFTVTTTKNGATSL